jgi:hypothetical protein
VPVVPPTTSALFPDQAAAVADLRAYLVMGAGQYINIGAVSDTMLWDKLLAAEADAERNLRVFFNAVEVIPDNAPQSEIDAFEESNTRYALSSNFDYDPRLFQGDAWGFMRLPFVPIQAIHSIIIAIPSPFLSSYTVPSDWIRLDRKYGDVRILPTSTAAVTPVGAYALMTMGGGAVYPQAVQVRYLCGIINVNGTVATSIAQHWNDLLDVVKRMAILKIMQVAFLPGSASISADGLSQSNSFDYDKWQGAIDNTLYGPKGTNGGIYTSIHGIVGLVA